MTDRKINVFHRLLRGLINLYFRKLNYRLVRYSYTTISEKEKKFKQAYNEHYQSLVNNKPTKFDFSRNYRYDAGVHPLTPTEIECQFTAESLSKLDTVETIMDVASYRQFVSGLVASFLVYSVDIRTRDRINENETVVTCDAKEIPLGDESVDAVTSLCALEHFGLGRYGDDFDLDADKNAFKEMIRIVRKNGHLIFSTAITQNQPEISFNAGRIYDIKMIREFCKDLTCIKEQFYCPRSKKFLPLEEINNPPRGWTLYLGDYRK